MIKLTNAIAIGLIFIAISANAYIPGQPSSSACFKATIIPNYNPTTYSNEIAQLYQTENANTIDEKINYFSKQFVGVKASDESLGEGMSSHFNQQPLYRTDDFDALSYASTVLAFAESHNLTSFEQTIKQIRFASPVTDFINQLRFISVWNLVNQRNGVITDVTKNIDPNASTINLELNLAGWYQQLKPSQLKLTSQPQPRQLQLLLSALQAQGTTIKATNIQIPTIPLTALFKKTDNNLFLNQSMLDKIPNASLIEIVVNDANMTDKIGTNMAIFNIGFAIKDNDIWLFRYADENQQKVVEIPLANYLEQLYQSTDGSAKFGINIEAVQAQE